MTYLCDLPGGATGALAGQIPDTIASDFDVTIQDTPDPVLQGGTTHLDLDVPFPDFTSSLPAATAGPDLRLLLHQADRRPAAAAERDRPHVRPGHPHAGTQLGDGGT